MRVIDTKIITQRIQTEEGPGTITVDQEGDDHILRTTRVRIVRDADSGAEISREQIGSDNVRLSELAKSFPEAADTIQRLEALLEKRAAAEQERIEAELPAQSIEAEKP